MEQAYETAKDMIYNIDQRPQPVRLLVICPLALVHPVTQHFKSLIRPDLKMVEDNGARFRFASGASVTIIARTEAKDIALYDEGEHIA